MAKILILLTYVLSFSASANEMFAKADLKAGKVLIEKNCISCHASSYGGNGSEIYTREFHKVKTPKELVAQVRTCSTNLDIKWFDDEEINAAAYLNHMYYKFE
jgi:mono/diheme cytochrome c family protein